MLPVGGNEGERARGRARSRALSKTHRGKTLVLQREFLTLGCVQGLVNTHLPFYEDLMVAKRKKKKTKKRVAKRGAKRKAVKRKVAKRKKATKRKVAKRKKTTKRKVAKKKKAVRRKVKKKKTARRKVAKKKKKATKRKVAKKKKAVKRKVKKKAPKKKKAKSKRKPNPAFMRPMTPDASLAAVVGDTPIPRTQVTKKLWAYIKRNNLQDSRNRRMINADAKLRPVFNGKSQVSMFEMTKLVNKHMK